MKLRTTDGAVIGATIKLVKAPESVVLESSVKPSLGSLVHEGRHHLLVDEAS